MNDLQILPLMIEELFKSIQSYVNSNPSKDLSKEHFIELHLIFDDILVRALEILDKSRILLFVQQERTSKPSNSASTCNIADDADNPLVLFQIIGSNGQSYKLFRNINYCPCESFRYQVLYAQTQYTCKHVLAVKLANILRKYKTEFVTPQQFQYLMKSLTGIDSSA